MDEQLAYGTDVELKPCIKGIDLADEKFIKLEMTQGQKMQVNALLGEVPALIAVSEMAQAYRISFPDGLQHELVKLKQGGYGSVFQENGRFGGTASLHPMQMQAVLLGAFTAMSIASGQYFLSEINSKLTMMKLSLDKILEFLYGDKRAELMAEICFVRYAYQNYGSIMEHDQQRLEIFEDGQEVTPVTLIEAGIIKNVQDGIKIMGGGELTKKLTVRASKFTATAKENADIAVTTSKAVQVKECLELSMQLYTMSSLLETYYSQNYDPDFIRYIETDVSTYINKCDKRMLSSFSALQQAIAVTKGNPFKKIDKTVYEKQVEEIVEALSATEPSSMQTYLRDALRAPEQRKDYYIGHDGQVYLPAS